jgi:hypothetical protein
MPAVSSSALGPLRTGAGALIRGAVAPEGGGLASWLQADRHAQQQSAANAAYVVLIMSPDISTIITKTHPHHNPPLMAPLPRHIATLRAGYNSSGGAATALS